MHGEETRSTPLIWNFIIVANDPAGLFRLLIEESKRAEAYAKTYLQMTQELARSTLAHEYEEHGVTVEWKKTGVTLTDTRRFVSSCTPQPKGTSLALAQAAGAEHH